ncbi:putative glucan endo-1,3-beta-D-glucosidase [Dioscorea sansibarensis]
MSVHLLLLFLLLRPIPHFSTSTSSSSSSFIGINYGQVGDNLPTPSSVLPLFHSLSVTRIRLYDFNPAILRPLSASSSSLDLTIGVPDRCLPSFASDPHSSLSWLHSNVLPYPSISLITLGNEVLTSNSSLLLSSLLPAINNLHSSLLSLNLHQRIKISTAHSLSILSQSFPPSSSSFRRDLLPILTPLLSFLSRSKSPFLINAYPYFAYKADPNRVDLDYVLFQPNDGVVDPGSGLRYDNMLHAQVDAVRSAISKAGGDGGLEIRVSETGWPSAGDPDEAGATPENARRYNGNLMRMVASGQGTPARPRDPLRVDIFALFNENLKPGPASERHYGLFKPDGTPAYQLSLAPASSENGTSNGSAASPPQQSSGEGLSLMGYDISSAAVRAWWAPGGGALGSLSLATLVLRWVL